MPTTRLEKQKLTKGTIMPISYIRMAQMAAQGYEHKEIGAKLEYSPRTVEGAFYDMIHAFNLRNRTHLVAQMIKYGHIKP